LQTVASSPKLEDTTLLEPRFDRLPKAIPDSVERRRKDPAAVIIIRECLGMRVLGCGRFLA
jgi:hypothetical protein